jgi:hypothetical protein
MRKVARCDECGWEWLPWEYPKRCPNRECRVRAWNIRGLSKDAGGDEPSAKPVERYVGKTSAKTEPLGKSEVVASEVPVSKREARNIPALGSRHRVGGKVCECGSGMMDWGRVWKCNICRKEVKKG